MTSSPHVCESGRASMNAADFDELSESEKTHFYKCAQCEETWGPVKKS